MRIFFLFLHTIITTTISAQVSTSLNQQVSTSLNQQVSAPLNQQVSDSLNQIAGLVTDREGVALPFVNIYLEGTTAGTTSNIDGFYTLDLPSGSYQLVFQYIGYKTIIETVQINGSPIELNIQLDAEVFDLNQITVNDDAEDPAYAIIKKAIAKRKYYKEMVQGYTCDAYIKGNYKLLDTPEKFFGANIGDAGGTLDSNRQGIVYLSESLAEFNFQQPNRYKERMISSKVSGADNAFSFNSAQRMHLNLYDNQWDVNGLGRPIISPIAKNALLFYKYKLLGTFQDKEGRLVNKIAVIPKRAYAPVYHGELYIIEDLWNIYSADLFISNESSKIELVDTLSIKQIHINIQDSIWVQFSSTVRIKVKAKVLNIEMEGQNSVVFSNYKINPVFPKHFFNTEVLKIEEEANERPLEYWRQLRPIPLTVEEHRDYVKKDSLQKIWISKVYQDSTDRKANKLKFINLFLGHKYRMSYKKRSFAIASPLSSLQYNLIQGINLSLDTRFKQWYDKHRNRWWDLSSSLNYGFAENKLRGKVAARYHFNDIKSSEIALSVGVEAVQFNRDEPITPATDSYFTLLYAINYIRLYESNFGKLNYKQELFNGLWFSTETEFSRRIPLENHTNFTLRRNLPPFASNNSFDNEEYKGETFLAHNAFKVGGQFSLRIKQKYSSYPSKKVIVGSKFPLLTVGYWKAFGFGKLGADYDLLSVKLRHTVDAKLVGKFRYYLESSVFLSDKQVPFTDYRHFSGNQSIFANSEKYLSTFQLMPYYKFSTTKPYFQAHVQHHFEGFLLNKIPGVNKLGFKTVMGAHYLYQGKQQNYLEFTLGLDNVGWKLFRIVRLDYVLEILSEEKPRSGFLIGLNLPFVD